MSSTERAVTRVAARNLTFDVHAGGPAEGEPVLLLHGFPQHSGEWDAVVPALHEAGLRTYALDQRGYSPGARPPAVDDYRIAECVADVPAVLDALGVDRAHLVGHDWGAVVAWHTAARYPERVRTMTAVSVPHPAAMAHAMATDAGQKARSSYIGLFRREGTAEQALLAADAARLRRLLAGTGRTDVYVEPMLAPGALTAALNWYRAMSRADLDGVGPVAVPTTYVWSDGDAAVGAVAAEACRDHVIGAFEFLTLAGVSHWIPDEAPRVLADAVLARVAPHRPR
jgi:pimeloyl-ACP methyl ester carboxylesterase